MLMQRPQSLSYLVVTKKIVEDLSEWKEHAVHANLLTTSQIRSTAAS